VCSPKKAKGKKDNKGEEIVNCQLMVDADHIRIVVIIEERDFECKVSYPLDSKPNIDLWWLDREKDIGEWLALRGHEELRLPVCSCVMRMLTPVRAIAKGAKGSLVPKAPLVQSFKWAYDTTRVRKGVLTIVATNGQQRVTSECQTTIDQQERNVIIHTSIRMEDKHTMHKGLFSYKQDAKMHTVRPWQEAQKALLAQACDAIGIPSEPAITSFDKSMVIVWEGVTEAMEIRHEKKSQKKDNEDGGLFELDGI
jgi:hypothetical protein